jgi:hypothetical protein
MGDIQDKFEDKSVREGGILKPHMRMVDALESLRDRVDNYNQFPSLISNPGETIKELKPDDFRWVMWENTLKFGYRMTFVNVQQSDYMLRVIITIMKPPDTFDDMSKREFKELMTSIAEVFFVQGAGEITNMFDDDNRLMMLSQMVPVMFQHEGNPNIVTPTKELINK